MRAVWLSEGRSPNPHSRAIVTGMPQTSAPVETQRTTVANRKIYVRPEHEPAWQKAVMHAQRTGTSLSEVVSIALREKFEAAEPTDTNA